MISSLIASPLQSPVHMQGVVVLGPFGPRGIPDQHSWPKRYRFPQRKRNEDSTKGQPWITSVITEGENDFPGQLGTSLIVFYARIAYVVIESLFSITSLVWDSYLHAMKGSNCLSWFFPPSSLSGSRARGLSRSP